MNFEIKSEKRLTAAVFLLAFGFCLITTKTRVSYSGNEASRLAMIEALVERGIFFIDASPFAWTTDKVFVDGHFYCDKPPLLPLFGAGEAWTLKNIFGVGVEKHFKIWLYLLTIVPVGLSAAWFAALFFKDTRRIWGVEKPGSRLIWTVAAFAGTSVLTYCGTYNNHLPAAAFLYAALSRLSMFSKTGYYSSNRKSIFLCGLFAGAAWAMDFPPGAVFLAAFFVGAILSADRSNRIRVLGWYALGAAAPILATLVVNMVMVGDPRPLYLLPGAYNYPKSNFYGGSAGGTFSPVFFVRYAFNATLGNRGVFSYSPILILAVIGAVIHIKNSERWAKIVAATVLSGFFITLIFYVSYTNNFGGWAYGFRYMAPATPLMVFFLGKYWIESAGVKKIIFIVALFASVLTASLGAFSPWSPCYEGERSDQNPIVSHVKSPFGANLMLLRAVLDQDGAPSSAIAKYFGGSDEAMNAAYMGVAFLNKGDLKRAEKMFNIAIKLNPNDEKIMAYVNAINSSGAR